ncbi:MAG: hypothetical protein MSS85_00040 [Pyramidobacter sp.]|nr:hypothetical protein [Pyramidobacter sp.]MCI7402464.1 hypothetical protein [Pyramidobacter sp.]MDY3212652.1 hypothetical protein [Pyramidobacter sp.]
MSDVFWINVGIAVFRKNFHYRSQFFGSRLEQFTDIVLRNNPLLKSRERFRLNRVGRLLKTLFIGSRPVGLDHVRKSAVVAPNNQLGNLGRILLIRCFRKFLRRPADQFCPRRRVRNHFIPFIIQQISLPLFGTLSRVMNEPHQASQRWYADFSTVLLA